MNTRVFAAEFVFSAIVVASAVNAHASIEWVDFSNYTDDALSNGPFSSPSGQLEVVVSITTNVSIFGPSAFTATVDDPTWQFQNIDVSTIGFRKLGLGPTMNAILRFDFTNPGGLPAGGSVGIIDLENADTTVTITGFAGGNEVQVDWNFAFYQLANSNIAPPTWDALTQTLTGGGEAVPVASNNFVFLVSNVRLDAVEFAIVDTPNQGRDSIQFGVTHQPVNAVPEAASVFVWLNLCACAGALLSWRWRA